MVKRVKSPTSVEGKVNNPVSFELSHNSSVEPVIVKSFKVYGEIMKGRRSFEEIKTMKGRTDFAEVFVKFKDIPVGITFSVYEEHEEYDGYNYIKVGKNKALPLETFKKRLKEFKPGQLVRPTVFTIEPALYLQEKVEAVKKEKAVDEIKLTKKAKDKSKKFEAVNPEFTADQAQAVVEVATAE